MIILALPMIVQKFLVSELLFESLNLGLGHPVL